MVRPGGLVFGRKDGDRERERESEREICLGCFVENGFSPTLDRSRLSYLFATEQGSADE
jgi:hypothetical protein